jgi:hypothetical protein
MLCRDTRVDEVTEDTDRDNRPSLSSSRGAFVGFRRVAERRTLLATFCIAGIAARRTTSRKRDPADIPAGGEVLSADDGEVIRWAGRMSWNVDAGWTWTLRLGLEDSKRGGISWPSFLSGTRVLTGSKCMWAVGDLF